MPPLPESLLLTEAPLLLSELLLLHKILPLLEPMSQTETQLPAMAPLTTPPLWPLLFALVEGIFQAALMEQNCPSAAA
jgi:hypothetical protein